MIRHFLPNIASAKSLHAPLTTIEQRKFSGNAARTLSFASPNCFQRRTAASRSGVRTDVALAHSIQSQPLVNSPAKGSKRDVTYALTHFGLAGVPVFWYYPIALSNPALMDLPPGGTDSHPVSTKRGGSEPTGPSSVAIFPPINSAAFRSMAPVFLRPDRPSPVTSRRSLRIDGTDRQALCVGRSLTRRLRLLRPHPPCLSTNQRQPAPRRRRPGTPRSQHQLARNARSEDRESLLSICAE